ncbi:hypothetical protein AVEN_252619-1 [Araneus ventricosus]|uniref:STPR domain-containing protein n=1 Tax=Araneus ventricosus TaxID=182803 RepID=A0A4Y2ARB8_ARAVE|nr:hypothetical protein AVEN_252619-1 [Araneus ventricosus]
MAQRGQKRRAEETEERRNKGLSDMAQRGQERKAEETEEQRSSRLSDMAQRSQERRAEENRRKKEWQIGQTRRVTFRRSSALIIWQDNWNNGETGSSTHNLVPRVSNKPVGWNREELMFVTGHGPFPSYLRRFKHMTTARAEEKEIQYTMPQNVGLPSPSISKLLQCHLNYSG